MPVAAPLEKTPDLNFYSPIARDLEEVERILGRVLQGRRPCVAPLIAHLEHYRGKRLRPALLLLTAHACGQVSTDHHVLAAVVEMIHTATLVHDDVLDEAAVRRHKSTVNAARGNQTSILLGDYLFTHAFHLASTVDARACRLIGEATNRVCEGELQQSSESGNLGLTEAEYLEIVDGKTAELTACCCRLGAIYSHANDALVERLTAFGRLLGIAFQIADDILDLVGEESRTGKSLGTDLQQRKMTLPLIRLLASAHSETAERVRSILQAGTGRESLRPFLASSGALEYARERALHFASKARQQLAYLPPSDCQRILAGLTDRVVHRDR